jgi:Tol biopolymer transport system component
MSIDRFARVERTLPGLFADLAEARTPDYLDAAIERASSRPQRPSWTFPERWLPVDLVSTRVPTTRMPWRQLAVLALIGLLLATLLAVYIGAHARHLPPPFGVAANGVIAYVTPSGDVAVADPGTGTTEVLVADPEQARAPSFSLDGTRVAYQRLGTTETKVMVVDLERRVPIQIAAIPAATDLLQWSPDGSKLAWISGKKVWIANTDGSGARVLDAGLQVQDEIEWRPPDGRQLVVRGERDGKAGLFLITLDGSEPRQITPLTTGEFDYLWLSWAPDGRRLAYSKADPKEVHLIDVDRGVDTMVHGDTGIGLMFPRWSPDGDRLAVMTWFSDPPVEVRIGVLPVDDPSPHITLTGPTFHSGIQHDWAPDGRSILATEWGSSQPWLLDPSGGPGRRPDWSASFPDWVEWQRLAP